MSFQKKLLSRMILSIVGHPMQAQRLRTKEATSGIFIPINVIQSDGENHVHVVRDQRAIRQYVDLLSMMATRYMLTGGFHTIHL